ncbi:MAG: hypothetical protein DCF16_18610 [Alphaproteobacteria bacterium]|nr:MAG: hypothetical protein DCF16_18610 [Alphaproteobacteria bacterium]
MNSERKLERQDLWVIESFGVGIHYTLQSVIIRSHGQDHILKRSVGGDWKGIGSLLLYICGTALTFVEPRLGQLTFVLVALIWLIPDRRIERALLAE